MAHSTVDRRRFVTTLAGCGALAGIVAPADLVRAAQEPPPTATPAVPLEALASVPWPYRPLDADEVGRAAFQVYQKGLCMRGVFEGVVGHLAARLGPPFTSFPFAMFGYGAGGAGGWGALCGTLNGAAAAISLLAPNPSPLIAALFSWYEQETLPDFVPPAARFPNVPVTAGSVLCHASVAAWCRAAKKPLASAERFERCGLLAASVARKTVLLLNAGATRQAAPDADTTACLSCHGRGGRGALAMGRMRCTPCHTPGALRSSGHPET